MIPCMRINYKRIKETLIKEGLIKSPMSFPRKRESIFRAWIPAFTGMTKPDRLLNKRFLKSNYVILSRVPSGLHPTEGRTNVAKNLIGRTTDSSLRKSSGSPSNGAGLRSDLLRSE
jgi:hypothetical protein